MMPYTTLTLRMRAGNKGTFNKKGNKGGTKKPIRPKRSFGRDCARLIVRKAPLVVLEATWDKLNANIRTQLRDRLLAKYEAGKYSHPQLGIQGMKKHRAVEIMKSVHGYERNKAAAVLVESNSDQEDKDKVKVKFLSSRDHGYIFFFLCRFSRF
jgi:hypothetical protein